ncbi:hypothetical protein EOW77_0026775 [Bradyrhizobium yuanmingense]|uniref:hypothetical protein n=1 Tax=Bradyrhizobium yuanmingense TaxID=108015 RepID=UPI000FE336FC|nr:hypothetical protein [Bradyrhizobium yuanmingense]TGN82059.1 hypothetical protein EOW77_0026775 [Bradyrhizobium yuanmingense]
MSGIPEVATLGVLDYCISLKRHSAVFGIPIDAWASPQALSAGFSFVLSTVTALLGIRWIAAPKTLVALWSFAALSGAVAFYSAAQQARDNNTLNAQIADQGTSLKAIARTLGIEGDASPSMIAQRAKDEEERRRNSLLSNLRQLYILSHDGLSSELLAGLAWPPDEWTNTELAKRGEPYQIRTRSAKIEWFEGALASVRVDCSAFWRTGDLWTITKPTTIYAGLNDATAGRVSLPPLSLGRNQIRPNGVDVIDVLDRKCR